MENYFEFYDLPVKYHLDTAELRKAYIARSREHHPDFHQLSEADKQDESLDQSSLNNAAFNALKDNMKRLEHILQLYNFLDDNKENLTDVQPEQMFLMEMMELNEAVEDAGKKNDDGALNKALEKNQAELADNGAKIEELMSAFDAPVKKRPQTDTLRDAFRHYLERKYLLRLNDLIHTFVQAEE